MANASPLNCPRLLMLLSDRKKIYIYGEEGWDGMGRGGMMRIKIWQSKSKVIVLKYCLVERKWKGRRGAEEESME